MLEVLEQFNYVLIANKNYLKKNREALVVDITSICSFGSEKLTFYCEVDTNKPYKMIADGEIVGDGSWNLTIFVTDLNEKRTMVVKGDMHIGGVMLKLTESFGKIFRSV